MGGSNKNKKGAMHEQKGEKAATGDESSEYF